MSQRLHYLDWLRVLAVLLLFPFHVSRVFNVGEPFYVKAPALSPLASGLIGFLDSWHMPLLFFVAGASTYFALKKRSGARYLGERAQRLLLPLVFGIFVLIPPQTWYGGRFNSGYAESFWRYLASGDFLVFNIRDGGDYYGGFGIGHLWFLLWLFGVSLMALPLLLWANNRGAEPVARFSHFLATPLGLVAAAAIIFVGEALPDVVGKNPFYYLAFFVLGYASVVTPALQDLALRQRWPLAVAGVALTVWWMVTGAYRDSLPDPSLPLVGVVLLGMLGRWLVILAAVGFGRRYLDRQSRALRYLAPASYPVYVFHQTAIVVLAFYVVTWPVAGWLQWLVLAAASVAASYGAYEVTRRIPVIRTLVGAS